MSNYDFGNFNKDKDFSLYQIGKAKKALADSQATQKAEQEKVQEQVFEQRKTDANL